MPYTLRAGLHYRRVDGHPIILDICQDRYLAAGEHAALAIEKLIAGDDLTSDCELSLAKLLSAGLIVESTAPQAISPPEVCAATSSHIHITARPALSKVLSSALEIARTERALRRRPLADLLLAIERRKPLGPEIAGRIDETLAAYNAASKLVPRNDKCLARSIALTNMLHRQGQPTTLVIGVMVRPFAAHCWVQSGATALNDEIDRVRCFTPILAI